MPHEVVVLKAEPMPDFPGRDRAWYVAVCMDCPWRGGEFWERAQTGVDDANVHRRETQEKGT